MHRPKVVAFFSFLSISLPTAVQANNIVVATGLKTQLSSWTGDKAGLGSLKIAYQWQSLSTYFQSRLGFANIDERVLQHLEVGAEYWLPIKSSFTFVRAGLTHRHEVPGEAISNSIGAFLGYGDGIRHRAGASAAVGLLVPISKLDRGDFFLSAEVNTDILVGAAGPRVYLGIGIGAGFTYSIGGGN